MTYNEFKTRWEQAIERDLVETKRIMYGERDSYNYDCEIELFLNDIFDEDIVCNLCLFDERENKDRFRPCGDCYSTVINYDISIVRRVAFYIKMAEYARGYGCRGLYNKYKETMT